MRKLIITLILALTTTTVAMAQAPKPLSSTASNNTDQIVLDGAHSPVGTATLLLLGLGGATVAYKVRKNTKKEND